MHLIKRNRNIILIMVNAFLLGALPTIAMAQGRGRALGHDKSWKCRVFVNCHDARDGRLDGRGPLGNRVDFRNGVFGSRRAHERFRNMDNEDRFRERRLRMRNRDFDNDEFFRHDRLRGRDRDFRNNDLLRGRGRGRSGR